jgi:pheromone a factor receptor
MCLQDVHNPAFGPFTWLTDQKIMSLIAIVWVYQALVVLALVLAIPILISQWRKRNFAVYVLVGGPLLLSLLNTINIFTWPWWHDNDWEGNILCDIEIKLYAGLPAAVTGAVACIFRQLANAVRGDRVADEQNIRAKIVSWTVDVSLCVLPMTAAMTTQRIFAVRRYNLTVVVGCMPVLPRTHKAILLQNLWLQLPALIALVYCLIMSWRLWQHHRQTSRILSRSLFAQSRYRRLLILSGLWLVVIFPVSIYRTAQVFSTSAEDVVRDDEGPASYSLSDLIIKTPLSTVSMAVFLERIVQAVLGITAFLVLGLGRDATKAYIAAGLLFWRNGSSKRPDYTARQLLLRLRERLRRRQRSSQRNTDQPEA